MTFTIFAGLVAFVLIGVIFVMTQVFKESTSEEFAEKINPEDLLKGNLPKEPKLSLANIQATSIPPIPKITPSIPLIKKQEKKSTPAFSIANLFANILISFNKKALDLNDDIPEVTPLPHLKEFLEKDKTRINSKTPLNISSHDLLSTSTGTRSITTNFEESFKTPQPKTLSKQEEINIEEQIRLSTELSEVKEKHLKLEQLFKEKSEELDRIQRSLDNELRNRKDFNKVKDILEKESKETKDRLKEIQGELINSRTENDGYKKRIQQFEDKATKLEKEIIAKENEIEDLKNQTIQKISEKIKIDPIPTAQIKPIVLENTDHLPIVSQKKELTEYQNNDLENTIPQKQTQKSESQESNEYIKLQPDIVLTNASSQETTQSTPSDPLEKNPS